jgi:hypothetical protein
VWETGELEVSMNIFKETHGDKVREKNAARGRNHIPWLIKDPIVEAGSSRVDISIEYNFKCILLAVCSVRLISFLKLTDRFN